MTDAASNQRQPQRNLGDEIALLAAQIDAATHRLLCLIREFDRQEKWAELDCLSEQTAFQFMSMVVTICLQQLHTQPR